MDCVKLMEEMGEKVALKWDQKDIEKWLHFIQLSQLIDTFKTASIDGSCIMLLEEDDLINDLGITSVIIRKKLLNWIQNGLQEYNQLVESSNKGSNDKIIYASNDNQALLQQQQQQFYLEQPAIIRPKTTEINQNQQQMPIEEELQQHNDQMEEEKNDYKQNNNLMMKDCDQKEEKKNKQYQLLVQPTEYINSSLYCIGEQGGKIGRHSCNQMVVLEESVSRYHAEIVFDEGKFKIADIGSTTGTFIKIQSQYELEDDIIIEMGSNQFRIRAQEGTEGIGENLLLEVIEGPNISEEIRVDGQQISSFTIGRKEQNNLVSYQEDQHLSNTHARIYKIESKWVIEDMSSTNGTWRRLSPEQTNSILFPLQDKSIFKVGSNSTFICEVKDNATFLTKEGVEKVSELLCIICVDNDRDAIYMPCRHNAACIKCTKQLKNCPICKVEIIETIRIYRA